MLKYSPVPDLTAKSPAHRVVSQLKEEFAVRVDKPYYQKIKVRR